jgi:hypothetical protein
MPGEQPNKPRLTIGNLQGQPLGGIPEPEATVPTAAPATGATPPFVEQPPPGVQESPRWSINEGELNTEGGQVSFRPDGVEALSYNNPFGQNMERVWFDGKLVFAVDVGEVDVDPAKVKVAQEYQIVYAVELDERGKLAREPESVSGQYNIYDSVPGMEIYSPIWQFNYVVVPRGYVPNTLRSARACEESGFPIHPSHVFEN